MTRVWSRVIAFAIGSLALLACGAALLWAWGMVHHRDARAQAGAMPLIRRDELGTKPVTDSLSEVAIEILGPVESVRGFTWPRGHDWVREVHDQPRSQIVITKPTDVAVRLPGGRSVRQRSTLTFFSQRSGVVVDTSLRPHSGLLGYQEAVELIETIVTEWDAQLSERSLQDINEWKAQGDLEPYFLARYLGVATLRGEDRARLSFQVRSTLDQSGWFVAIDVAATLAEQRKLWGQPDDPTEVAAATAAALREGSAKFSLTLSYHGPEGDSGPAVLLTVPAPPEAPPAGMVMARISEDKALELIRRGVGEFFLSRSARNRAQPAPPPERPYFTLTIEGRPGDVYYEHLATVGHREARETRQRLRHLASVLDGDARAAFERVLDAWPAAEEGR